jgi:predicted MFS family arabinose efflux permease
MTHIYPPHAVIVLALANVAGLIDLVALPLWIGTLVQHGGLDYEHAGITVTLFLLGVVAASLWCAPRFERLPRRACAIGGYALSAACFLLAPQVTGWSALLALHLLAGIGTGSGLSMAHGAMGRAVNPHRLFAYAGTALRVFAVLFYALVPMLMARVGAPSLFIAVGGMMACAAAAATAFPGAKAGVAEGGVPHAPRRIPPLPWLMVIGVGCLALNQNIMFSFLERIGIVRGFGREGVNGVLAAVGIINLFSAPLAGLLQRRLSVVGVALGAGVVQVALAVTITASGGFVPYAAAGSLYAFVMIFAHPFLFGLTARLDPSGRTNALTPAMLMAGSALAPAIAGTVAQRFGFGGLGVAVAAVGIVGCVSFVLLGRALRRTTASALPSRPIVG